MITGMLHRFDFHVHSFFSKDAASPPEDLIAAAISRGLSGIAITDHDSCEAHAYLAHQKIPGGFLVIPGVEVSTAHGHLLCLGATLPLLRGVPAPEVVEKIHAAGGIPIPAHPFDRWRAGIRPEILDTLNVDTLEVFNAAVTSRAYNDRALAYAESQKWKKIAASDAHHASAVGVSVTELELDELSVPAVLAALRKGGRPAGQYLSFREGMKKHFANWFRKGNRRPPSVVRRP